jgi:hypothetical protein
MPRTLIYWLVFFKNSALYIQQNKVLGRPQLCWFWLWLYGEDYLKGPNEIRGAQ